MLKGLETIATIRLNKNELHDLKDNMLLPHKINLEIVFENGSIGTWVYNKE